MRLGANNPAIEEHLNHLFSQILLEQKNFMGVKDPDPKKAELLEKKLENYALLRGRGFFFNSLATGRGHGPFSEILDGSVKYDLVGSMGVNLFGHSHPMFIKAHLEGATMDTVMVGNLHLYEDSIELSEKLINLVSGSKLKHFWFAGSGSFANDNALKMIWQKSEGKTKILALEKCFAGRSIATQDITHNKDYKVGMPTHLDVLYFNIQEDLEKTIEHLERIRRENNDDICCLTLELVQGEGGFNIFPKEIYEGIFKWAQEHKIFIWVDEIQSFGRTGELFAFQTLGLEAYPDIVTVGKALQVCGTLFSEELNPAPGLIAGTFQGSLVAIKSGIKVLEYLSSGNFFGEEGRIAQIRKSFETKMDALITKNDFFTSHNGKGMMFAFQVGAGEKGQTANFIKKLFEKGIICFSCGRDPYRVRFLLPLCLTEEHIVEIFEILENAANELNG